jgi:hypothetical protein
MFAQGGVREEVSSDRRQERTYHRLVKTTPKPSATKNSKGELVGPPELLEDEWVEVAVGAELAVVAEDMFAPLVCRIQVINKDEVVAAAAQ